jgi:hypothetical protein
MRKKRAITLLEIMIVIVLIGLVGGVLSYNLKGTLDKGKAFRSEQGAAKLQDILNLEIQQGFANAKDLAGDKAENRSAVSKCISGSGLISAGEVNKFVKDGWGDYYTIVEDSDARGVRVDSIHVPSKNTSAANASGG